jgi:hypothetical protein
VIGYPAFPSAGFELKNGSFAAALKIQSAELAQNFGPAIPGLFV